MLEMCKVHYKQSCKEDRKICNKMILLPYFSSISISKYVTEVNHLRYSFI